MHGLFGMKVEAEKNAKGMQSPMYLVNWAETNHVILGKPPYFLLIFLNEVWLKQAEEDFLCSLKVQGFVGFPISIGQTLLKVPCVSKLSLLRSIADTSSP